MPHKNRSEYTSRPEVRQKINQQAKEWRLKNREKVLAQQRERSKKRTKESRRLEYLKWKAAGNVRVHVYDHVRITKRYGVDQAWYAAKLESQNGVCALCKRNGEKRKLGIDHDHKCCDRNGSCGKCVRGLLCSKCNTALERFETIADFEVAVREYLKEFGG